MQAHLDVNKAVQNFLKNFESLSCLPLITDIELDRLFGQEIADVLVELDKYNRQKQFCRDCSSRCCKLVDCEVYDTELNRCPIHSLRPLLCRMHYCDRFSPVYRELVKEIGDVFLDSLLAAERMGDPKVSLFDCPPFKLNIKSQIKNNEHIR